MNRRNIFSLTAMTALALAMVPTGVVSQQRSLKEQLLGTWILVSHESVRPDGSRTPVYGLKPNGVAFFDAGGHFIITVMRSDRAKYAIENPTQGTVEENKATAQGTITYFGKYSVSEVDRRVHETPLLGRSRERREVRELSGAGSCGRVGHRP